MAKKNSYQIRLVKFIAENTKTLIWFIFVFTSKDLIHMIFYRYHKEGGACKLSKCSGRTHVYFTAKFG